MAMQPYPDEPQWWLGTFKPEVQARYEKAGVPLDDHYPIWFARTAYDIAAGLTKEDSARKHLRELEQVLGIAEPEPEPEPHPDPLQGPLKISGRGFVDDSGPVLPRFKHFGEAFSAYCHGKRIAGQDVLAQLDAVAAAGYHGIRFWDVLGYYDCAKQDGQWVPVPDGWYGRAVTPIPFKSIGAERFGWPTTPATPDYYAKLAQFLRELHLRDLRVLHDRGDLNSWSDSQKYEHCHRVGQVYRELGDVGRLVLAGGWAVNEAFHNGVHDPAVAARMLEKFSDGAGWLPSVRGLSDYDQSESPTMFRQWSVPPATVYTCHPLRDAGNPSRMLEHYFSNPYGMINGMGEWAGAAILPFFYTEPIGAGEGVSVDRTDNVELLCSLAIQATIGGAGYCHMSGYGVFWDGRLEAQAGFYEVPRAITRLPKDIHRFRRVHHSGTTWSADRVFVANDQVRVDGAVHSDGRFVYVTHADDGPIPVTCAKTCQVNVVHPVTGAVEWSGVIQAGEQLPVRGEIARVLVGRIG